MQRARTTVMSEFRTDLVVRKVRGRSHKYELAAPLLFFDSELGHVITVPKGFKTDLSTYWIEGKHTEAAIVHDYLLVHSELPREIADQVMYNAMKSLGVRKYHKSLIYLAIRLYGWFK